jgi:hypothetical protein
MGTSPSIIITKNLFNKWQVGFRSLDIKRAEYVPFSVVYSCQKYQITPFKLISNYISIFSPFQPLP